ncbi:MAG: hypothetical protein AB1489_03490 [Acidobacteriota bacterium]
MLKIISGLLCAVLLMALGRSSGAAPITAADEEGDALQTFLRCSNDVMVASLGLEIHYKQIPASRIQVASLRNGTSSTEIRKFLARFARLNIANPIKTSNTTLPPGQYVLGLYEEKTGSGRWFFALQESSTGRQLTRLDPVMDTLTPALCARVMTMEIDRKPGSNRFKIKMKWGDLSLTTRETLEI